MKPFFTFIKKELIEMLPPTIFFFLVFHIILFVHSLISKEYGIVMTSSISAGIGALIIGKSILIADALPLFRWFSQRRLIYNVLWRVVLYMTIFMLFEILEKMIPLISKEVTVEMAGKHFLGQIQHAKFLATFIIITAFLFIYSVATAIIQEVGEAEIVAILLGKRCEKR
ncbi:MAG TPA: hypothetical protein VIM96_03285 [Pseudomonadales bacterium]